VHGSAMIREESLVSNPGELFTQQLDAQPTMRPCATLPIADNHSEHQQQMPNLALSYWLVPGAS
jgi:hypothetical protein